MGIFRISKYGFYVIFSVIFLALLCGCGKNKAEQISEITKILSEETTSEATSYDEASVEETTYNKIRICGENLEALPQTPQAFLKESLAKNFNGKVN